MALAAIIAGPRPISELSAVIKVVRGKAKLMAVKAFGPIKCPATMASIITVNCKQAEYNRDAFK